MNEARGSREARHVALGVMHTREALLRDAGAIYRLIRAYATDGTLLPRTMPRSAKTCAIS